MIAGKFTATFIGVPTENSDITFGKNTVSFEVTEFNNFKCTESRRIAESELNQEFQKHSSLRINTIMRTQSVTFPLPGGIVNHQIDWGNFRYHNPVFSAVHHTNRGYHFPFLKNFTLLDAVCALVTDIVLFLPRLFRPRLGRQINSQIFVGYLEADFVCRIAP